jgi:hypothetical protein
MTLNVYIGYDVREPEAYDTCKFSLLKHSSKIDVQPLKHRELRKQGLFTRPWIIEGNGGFRDVRDDKPFSTEFAFTRFLIPFLQDKGWALFCDSDMLFTDDVMEILKHVDDKFAVMVVKHNYIPETGLKMDDCKQEPYSRKNWSSVILWNCEHPSNKKLTIEDVNYKPGNWLHNFKWLSDEEIGSLPEEWNWLEGHSPMSITPKNIHYTRGGPWFKDWKGVAYGKEWLAEFGEMNLPK